MSQKLNTYISLFSGAGVGCYGFKLEGFECIATNEIISKRLDIQKYNNKCRYKTGYIDGDLTELKVKNQLFSEIEFWQKKHNIKIPDVLIATPPCQGMSVANHKKGDEKKRNSLVVESIKLTQKIKPKFFIFENVRAFLKTICTDLDGIDKSIGESIDLNLSGEYSILRRVVNLKDYGSNSSRTRTIVIGVRKDTKHLSPYDIFPEKKPPKTLRKLIGDLKPLNTMGEISNDIFHSYRKFDPKMLPWIENIKEGQSAFDNNENHRIPHQLKNGKIVYNSNKNGDKYSRWFWDREGPCIHTRNDILASQSTIHPRDNRVFSIREIMLMLTIPNSFEWSKEKQKKINKLPLADKNLFLKTEELNIRKCLGESVPTEVFQNIASKIVKTFEKKELKNIDVKNIIKKHNLVNTSNLIDFINNSFEEIPLESIFLIAELSNSERQNTAAYFTRQDIVYSLVKELPEFKNKKEIRILEPAVGVGNFIPLLLEKYSEKDKVIIDVCDIDENSLLILKTVLKNLKIPNNFIINVNHVDFLLWDCTNKYDLVIGNPPFGKLSNSKKHLKQYKEKVINQKTNNIFSFFVEKSLKLGKYVSFIIPKSFLNAPEFNTSRDLLNSLELLKIVDYGEKAFQGVKIETISFLCSSLAQKSDKIFIESFIKKTYKIENKSYIFSNDFPSWLIYRNSSFDKVVNKMNLNIFESYRDRQITKKITKKNGKVRVLKSRNIGNNSIKDIDDYDCYIDEISNLSISKYCNRENVVLVPNLTYYPRGAFLPKNSIVDGSVALLTLKNGNRLPKNEDLEFYSTEEFEQYYRVARNHGTRSLNIDNNSVFFFGLLKN